MTYLQGVTLLIVIIVIVLQQKQVEGFFGKKKAKEGTTVDIATELGIIRGSEQEGYRYFKSIPFIEAPVGERRFKEPVPKKPWEGVMEALTYGAGCPQDCALPPGTCPESYSEDCITMSIFTPAGVNETSKLPVIVFFPGGHFDQGGPNVDLYDGRYVTKRTNVIVVNIGYRIGALGWLSYEDIGLRGNFGLLDQRVGLEFVRDHIAKFGGNPDAVTISGQSAGGISVLAHLISEKSWGLYHRAIVQSNPLVLPIMNVSTMSKNFGKHFMKQLGCSTLDCVMNAKTGDIVEAQEAAGKKINLLKPLLSFLPLTVVVDNDNIKYNGFEAITRGKLNNVPIIMGATTEEALLFIYLAMDDKLNTAKYVGFVSGIFWRKFAAAKVLAKYAPPLVGDKRPLFAKLGSDYIFHCSHRYALNAHANLTDRAPIYYYEFNQTLSFDGWGPKYPFCKGHACHGVDLVYRFHSANVGDMNFQFTSEEEQLSNLFIDSLDNFIKTGDPNKGATLPTHWPAWDANMQGTFRFSEQAGTIKYPRPTTCNMWDSLAYPYSYGY